MEVKIDGGIHLDPKQAAYDVERTKFLEARGIRVLRFQAEEVEKDLPGVLLKITAAVRLQS